MKIEKLVGYLDSLLDTNGIPDYPGALNGLQVETTRLIGRIGVAVDASLDTISQAVDLDVDLMIVHHGLFWGGPHTLTGRHMRRVAPLIHEDIGLYSAHLPLDVHPEFGNNAVLSRELGLSPHATFGDYKGVELGRIGMLDGALSPDAFRLRLNDVLGADVRLLRGGPSKIRKVGVITGGAGSMINDAIAAGCDAFVTGEGNHHSYFDAVEGGINVYYGGHYATETWGVRALAEHLEDAFGFEWEFIDIPTGL